MAIQQLDELFDYKNQLMEDLLTNSDIVKLINEDVSVSDASSLAYTQVFPYDYIPDTVETDKTLVCFDVDIQGVSNKTYLTPVLYIWVFIHKSKLRLPEGGVRTDKLCSAIAEEINGSRKYGLCELDLYSVRRYAAMTNFQGKVMTFYAKDFNKPYKSDKYTPSNRKRG